MRQFIRAVAAGLIPSPPAQGPASEDVGRVLPPAGVALFEAMPPVDRRHSLNVLAALERQGLSDPALAQAALLHDCAKHEAGIRLWHRVAMVLLPLVMPARLAEWKRSPAPRRGSWRYPLWAHLNHPARGAELAAASGCDALAVELIRLHQEGPGADRSPSIARLLGALQAADDDN